MAVIYGVSQVTAYLRELLAYDDVLADIWIEGEVANLRRPGSGHAYFTLRDSRSSLRGVLFRNSRGLENLQDGAAVVAHGRGLALRSAGRPPADSRHSPAGGRR